MTEEGFTVWVTGPKPAPVQAITHEVIRRLVARHVPLEVLHEHTPGVEALTGPGLERRVALVAAMLARHGVATIVSLPAPRRADRDRIRAELVRMIEVYVWPLGESTPAAYEPPEKAEVEITVPEPSPGAGAERVLHTLAVLGLLPRDAGAAYSEDEEREVIRRLKAFGYL